MPAADPETGFTETAAPAAGVLSDKRPRAAADRKGTQGAAASVEALPEVAEHHAAAVQAVAHTAVAEAGHPTVVEAVDPMVVEAEDLMVVEAADTTRPPILVR
jgi:hypothetical protein